MHKRTYMEISSFIVLLSIMSIVLQFTSYYFIASEFLLLGLCSIISLLCNHILAEQSQSYQSCFLHSILSVFISLLIYSLTYFGENRDFIHYNEIIVGIVILNWVIPTLYCFLRQILGFGAPIQDFITFFRNNSLVFLTFYVTGFTYGQFAESAFPWIYQYPSEGINLRPFWSIASQIEAQINGSLELSQIISYLLSRILFYIPYGYFITLVLRNLPRLIRYLMLLLLPVAVEILQYYIIPSRCDIDDIIYGFIGSALGALLFYLTNVVFRVFSGREFLPSNYDYHRPRGGLRF